MFNPYPYDDPACTNRPKLREEVIRAVVSGNRSGVAHLCSRIERHFAENSRGRTFVIGMDGYISAEWLPLINLLSQELGLRKIKVEALPAESCYKSTRELDEMLASFLPEDREIDPVLLFGRLFEGGYEELFSMEGVEKLEERLRGASSGEDSGAKKVIVIYGCGVLWDRLRRLCDLKLFFDVTPRETITRIKTGRVKNLGDASARPYKLAMRRCYYFDFELAGRLRSELLTEQVVDYYVESNDPHDLTFLPLACFNELCSTLVKYPFRCKPVYNEGIWGGHFFTRVRNLPAKMKNCAWVFDLIPLEVSLSIQVGERLVEIPYFTFVRKEGTALMGSECVKKFGGYFPIRLNYDDTWHSSGNMSIQVHPDRDYAREHFGELGGQDESYYVVATGHDAKTYLGFEDGVSVDEFYRAVEQSERDATPVDYQRFVHAVETKPGTQVMLPGGTIHASGQNQVVLEIGSLTVGSYTFKMYDYLRKDLDGKPRPIHSIHGKSVLRREWTGEWVERNLVPEPRPIREGESIVGEHDLIYFSLRRLDFDREIEDDTAGLFHVLTLVDGEEVRISSLENPERFYIQKYLDIVVVPASFGKYKIENLGNCPVRVHKTRLKDGFAQF